MGINAILTPTDLLKGEAVTPGWYPAEIHSYDEAVTKGSEAKPSDGSMNAIFEFKILDGPYKDRILKRYFNEKSLGFGKNLWNLLFQFDKQKGGQLTSEMFAGTVGQKMQIYVKKGNNGFDSVEDWRPLV